MASQQPKNTALVCSACGIYCTNMQAYDGIDCLGRHGVSRKEFLKLEKQRGRRRQLDHCCNGGCEDCMPPTSSRSSQRASRAKCPFQNGCCFCRADGVFTDSWGCPMTGVWIRDPDTGHAIPG